MLRSNAVFGGRPNSAQFGQLFLLCLGQSIPATVVDVPQDATLIV